MTHDHAPPTDPTLISRIWGPWTERFYRSGTTIVRQTTENHKPWLYVYADAAIDESRYMGDRFRMCYELRDYMNGLRLRPSWLADFDRVSETRLESLAGASIHAVGPMVDRDPPNLDWVQDDSDDAENDRARLIDALTMEMKP